MVGFKKASGERLTSGHAPGLGVLLGKLIAGRGRGKKTSGRIPNPPAERLAQHHLARWRDEGRGQLVAEALRLGLLGTERAPVGRGGQYATWKALAVDVARAREVKREDVGW